MRDMDMMTGDGHPGSRCILWVHNGSVDSRAADDVPHSDLWGFWNVDHDGIGRVFPDRKSGNMMINPDIGRRKARGIVEDVLEAFPGIRFRIFFDGRAGVSVQEFWEATE